MKKLSQIFALVTFVMGMGTIASANPGERFIDAAMSERWDDVYKQLDCPNFQAHIAAKNSNLESRDPKKYHCSLFFTLQLAAFQGNTESVTTLLAHHLAKNHITDNELHLLLGRVNNPTMQTIILDELKRRNPKASCSSCWCC